MSGKAIPSVAIYIHPLFSAIFAANITRVLNKNKFVLMQYNEKADFKYKFERICGFRGCPEGE
jgi:hypothetical protein